MKLCHFLPALMVLFLISCSRESKVLEKDKTVTRNELFYEINQQEPFSGKIVEKHPNGQLKYEMELVDGKPDGKTTEYYENGQVKQIYNFKDGKPSGEYKSYAQNGQVIEEGEYTFEEIPNDDKTAKARFREAKIGKWTVYFENGQKRAESNFVNGKPDGKVIVFTDKGTIDREKEYKNGEKVGIWTDYSKDGKKIQEVNYFDGKQNSLHKNFDESGKVSSEGYYDSNIARQGQWKYYSDGKLIRTEVFENNIERVDEKIMYDANGQPIAK